MTDIVDAHHHIWRQADLPWLMGPMRPRIFGPYEGRAAWRAGMKRLVACPNVLSKLSALGTFIHRNDPTHIATVVRETAAMLGAHRCLFGSNFPIEKLWTSYRELVESYRAAAASLPAEQQEVIFRTTAMRVYWLGS